MNEMSDHLIDKGRLKNMLCLALAGERNVGVACENEVLPSPYEYVVKKCKETGSWYPLDCGK